MEQERFRIPAGAVIACILVILFVLACITGIGLWLKSFLSERGASKQTENPVQTQEAVVTEAPTQQPDAVTTDKPSDTLITGTQVTPDTEKTAMIAQCMSAVVSIDITMYDGTQEVDAGSGSGVLITSGGYIVTCNHVVEGAASIYVFLNDGSQYKAELIGNDSVTDIAVIRITDSRVFPFATLGNSSDLMVGEDVYVIGNALGQLSNTVTEGIISGLDRDIEVDGQSMTLLQTSAAINSGNSGGAMFRADGTLIGIVNAKSSGTTSSGATIEGLGFAVPIDLAKPIITDIMDYGFVTGRPYLGVTTKNISYGYGMFSYYTYPQVVSVIEGSPAEIAGIMENDIIVAINGEAVSSSTQLRVMINTFKIGDEITVTVQRGNNTYNLSVVLQEKTFK
ncbi:MAG: trypsin-like peptidase domain-containing protein [Clostridia bacterium]|nr:trypsin-like peptidase domain-containing protein [Clostridia bacterium]